jgi:quercetin dioxygenase-like cupin family protein
MNKLIAAVAIVVASAAYAAEPKPADHKKVAIYVPAGDLKWNPMDPSQPAGPAIAVAAGEPKNGPIAMFMKFPAGFDSGWHIHKNWYVGAVVKGTMTSQGQGDAAAKELPVGSYFSEPGNKNHKNTCTAAGECIIFGYMEKGHNFEPRDEAGKKIAAAPAAKPAEAGKPGKGDEKKADAPGQAKKEEKKEEKK